MSRISRVHPVLFLEDAAPAVDGEPRMHLESVSDSLVVATPLLIPKTGDPTHDATVDERNGRIFDDLLAETVAELRRRDPAKWTNIVHWIYTPMAAGLRTRFEPVGVVYDCMDELANFRFAPPELKELERQLMEDADVIFTGGPSMYAARQPAYPGKVYQFNSGVDVDHFRAAQDPATEIPSDASALQKPILLYYGVIDERMGWDNLAAVCDSHPEWTVLMVGPMAKITEEDLLHRPNIVYTGQRDYSMLPGYLKASNVAMVPFALSDATRYLSPTKTLEYFAAGRPVVSTPIQDIVDHYSDAARIATTPDEFVAACERAISGPNSDRLTRGEAYANANTWSTIVDRMLDLVDNALDRRHPAEPQTMSTGQVRWYSGSRGAGEVDRPAGAPVLAYLPGEAQEDLGVVREGDPVAVGAVVPHLDTGQSDGVAGGNMFPLGLDRAVPEGSTE